MILCETHIQGTWQASMCGYNRTRHEYFMQHSMPPGTAFPYGRRRGGKSYPTCLFVPCSYTASFLRHCFPPCWHPPRINLKSHPIPTLSAFRLPSPTPRGIFSYPFVGRMAYCCTTAGPNIGRRGRERPFHTPSD